MGDQSEEEGRKLQAQIGGRPELGPGVQSALQRFDGPGVPRDQRAW